MRRRIEGVGYLKEVSSMKVLIADQGQVTKLFPMDTWVEIGGRHFGSAAAN
jgi:hypothetical protein